MLLSPMLLVGLTGGVATGKSTVACLFQDCGAIVLDADQLARRVVEPGEPAYRGILRAFGRKVLRTDRTLDRSGLARIVFRHPAKLKLLNSIVHPRVAREQAALTRKISEKTPNAIIMYDAPVLIEAGAHQRMDHLIVVTADRRTQIARLKKRNGLTRAEALRRIRAQMPLAKKVKLADSVLDGNLPIHRLRQNVKRLYSELKTLNHSRPCPDLRQGGRKPEK